MSLPQLPYKLTSLTEREAVTDTLYRILNAFDTYDLSLLESSFLGSEVSFEMNGNAMSFETMKTQVFDKAGPMDTSHTVSNVRVDLKDGASTAALTATALAQHCPPGKGMEVDGPKYLGASMYFLDLVKDESEGLWKVKKFAMKVIWVQGDPSVMA